MDSDIPSSLMPPEDQIRALKLLARYLLNAGATEKEQIQRIILLLESNKALQNQQDQAILLAGIILQDASASSAVEGTSISALLNKLETILREHPDSLPFS